MNDEPRAYTVLEVRQQFLDTMRAYVRYWKDEDRAPTVEEKLDGLAFSFLNMLDGTSAALPAFNLKPAPHPDDKAYLIENGENYYDDDMVINDCYLHDLWYNQN